MSHPSSLATAHTLDFIGFYLPSTKARLLEVGCGAGDLACELKKLGHEVVAIDASEKACALARAKGVAARAIAFGDFDDVTGFDAILFTRSLHHVSPLEAALQRARRLLRPRGVLLVEDLELRAPDAATLRWDYACRLLLRGGGDLPDDAELHKRWIDGHHHEPRLHEADEMDRALRAVFERVELGTVPYLYRDALKGIEERADGEALARTLLQWETREIEAGHLQAIGRRWIATNLVQ